MNPQALVVGVDGGGTHTRARVADAHGRELARAETGSSNLSVVGIAGAQAVLAHVISDALARSDGGPIAAICLGISGVDRANERELFRAWARQYAPRIAIVNDSELVLAAGTPDGWGLALIAGTGSIGFAKSQDGRVARAGGWGYLIGDEGSGGELGREAVRAAVQAADGRAAPTRLLADILAFWGLRSPDDLVDRVYRAPPDSKPLRPGDLAALAPLVLHAASAGDPAAEKLVAAAVRALSDLALTLARKLAFPAHGTPLALGGGLLVGAAAVQAHMLAACAESGYEFAPVGLVNDPVAGAVQIARRLLDLPNG